MDTKNLRIGLTLSGGGHRAGAFHLGVLARLADGNLLNKIKLVSTVSGGSIVMGLIYAANNNQWFTREAYKNHILPAMRKLYTERNLESDFMSHLTRFPIRWLRRRANHLAEALSEDWGMTGELSRLTSDPRWIINATTIETGKNWRFDREVMGDYKVGYTLSGKFPISEAVAASAGFPVFIGPLEFASQDYCFVETYAEAKKAVNKNCIGYRLSAEFELKELNLWDGGLYDNLGIQAVLRHFKPEPRAHNNAESVSSSNLELQLPMFDELYRADRKEIDQEQPTPEVARHAASTSSPDLEHDHTLDLESVKELKADHNRRLTKDQEAVNFLIVSDASPAIKPTSFDRKWSFKRLVTLPADHTRMMYSKQIVTVMRAHPYSGAYLQFDNDVGYVLGRAKHKDHMLEDISDGEINQIAAESLSKKQIAKLADFGTSVRKMTHHEFSGIYRHGYELADATLYAYNSELGAGFEHIPFKRHHPSP
ncbi:MAG: patatin-like phospholipase family protein [Anaerolineae bacterium]|nr:patatin-like phospholipase family protein [Anaerolineae bacterium]